MGATSGGFISSSDSLEQKIWNLNPTFRDFYLNDSESLQEKLSGRQHFGSAAYLRIVDVGWF
jgi:hypothetical protein